MNCTRLLLLLGILTTATAHAAPVTISSALPSQKTSTTPAQPLADGFYVFQQRYAEHPHMPGILLDTEIKQGKIYLTNNDRAGVFPLGLIDEGELYWHPRSGQWIIVNSAQDKSATEVGGCSDGPVMVDLKKSGFIGHAERALRQAPFD